MIMPDITHMFPYIFSYSKGTLWRRSNFFQYCFHNRVVGEVEMKTRYKEIINGEAGSMPDWSMSCFQLINKIKYLPYLLFFGVFLKTKKRLFLDILADFYNEDIGRK